VAELVALLLLGLLSWVLRIAFVLLVPAERLPAAVRRGLDYLAPAVLAAVAAVQFVTVTTTGGDHAQLWGSLAAIGLVAVVAYVTRNLTAVVGVALIAIVVLDLVIG
jgi:branched-subunit amino acid transport protein